MQTGWNNVIRSPLPQRRMSTVIRVGRSNRRQQLFSQLLRPNDKGKLLILTPSMQCEVFL